MKKTTVQDSFSPHRLWLGLFAVWVIFLSGALGFWMKTPGVVQALRLTSLLGMKQTQMSFLESDIQKLETEIDRLDKSRVAQEREIRRTLGYAGADEIIFDFSSAVRPEDRLDPRGLGR